MIVDREAEIRAFQPEEYWTIDAKCIPQGSRKQFPASFYGDENGKIKITSEEQANGILEELKDQEFIISKVKKGTRRKSPAPPFITSTPVSYTHLNQFGSIDPTATESPGCGIFDGAKTKFTGHKKGDNDRGKKEAVGRKSAFDVKGCIWMNTLCGQLISKMGNQNSAHCQSQKQDQANEKGFGFLKFIKIRC